MIITEENIRKVIQMILLEQEAKVEMEYFQDLGDSAYEFGKLGDDFYITTSPKKKAITQDNPYKVNPNSKAYKAIKDVYEKIEKTSADDQFTNFKSGDNANKAIIDIYNLLASETGVYNLLSSYFQEITGSSQLDDYTKNIMGQLFGGKNTMRFGNIKNIPDKITIDEGDYNSIKIKGRDEPISMLTLPSNKFPLEKEFPELKSVKGTATDQMSMGAVSSTVNGIYRAIVKSVRKLDENAVDEIYPLFRQLTEEVLGSIDLIETDTLTHARINKKLKNVGQKKLERKLKESFNLTRKMIDEFNKQYLALINSTVVKMNNELAVIYSSLKQDKKEENNFKNIASKVNLDPQLTRTF